MQPTMRPRKAVAIGSVTRRGRLLRSERDGRGCGVWLGKLLHVLSSGIGSRRTTVVGL